MAPVKRSKLPLLLTLLLIAGAGIAYLVFFRGGTEEQAELGLWRVAPGHMRVTVLEGGSLEAMESVTVASEVEGQAAILKIVEEGRIISAEDVANGLVLVRLDDSEITDRLERQKIERAAAEAALENAVNNLEIQREQNASDIRKAELDVRFARLDLERYVGKRETQRLLEAYGTAEALEGRSIPETAEGADGETTGLRRILITLLESEELEGESLQMIRLLDTDIQLAEEELRRAEVKLDWTRRLVAKGYVSREDEEADRIAVSRLGIERERAITARQQYADYDFAKEVEQLLSSLVEAREHLDRTRKRARAAEAMAEADVRSRTEQAQLQESRVLKYEQQKAACIIRAPQEGLVVYASSGRRSRWGSGDRIQEGTTVRERQPIIRIPDLSSIGVKVDVHESMVERVEEGQPVTVVVDALPDVPLKGEVTQVARLPNPSDSWLNPDLKVYATEISLDGVPEGLRPGMSAQVEIGVAELHDVLKVPVQAIAGSAERPVVWIADGEELAERPVRLGASNDRYVQILDGLYGGEQVLLAPPRPDRLSEDGPREEADDASPGTGEQGPPAAVRPAAGRPAPSSARPSGGSAPARTPR
ncbi:MAG: efflux RND transporter periplasmic adaptor subunit [Planctomycetota bacterium]